jgi:hypothetical protein
LNTRDPDAARGRRSRSAGTNPETL